jgi:hypothetical protein
MALLLDQHCPHLKKSQLKLLHHNFQGTKATLFGV